jgi:hypothetical protein
VERSGVRKCRIPSHVNAGSMWPITRDVVADLTLWAVVVPEVVVLRPESGPYSANADAIRARVLNEVPPSPP